MVAVKAADADAALSRIDPLRPLVLLFGPDAGLVRERAAAFVARARKGSDDPFGLVRLDGDEIAGDPARLVDEAGSIALFGGRRVVWVRAGARNITPAVEALLAGPPPEAVIVVEAGDLKRSAPLRSACESSPRALAVACYADGERDLVRLIDTMVSEAGLAIDRDARDELVPLLGGDRLASRGEIAKLLLYAAGERRVTATHVRAIVGDASALALDAISDNALAGIVDESVAAYGKAMGEGMRADVVLGAVSRAGFSVHAMRAAVEAGGTVERAIESARPAIHFRRKPLVERALRVWTGPRLTTALIALDDSLLAARRSTALAPAIGERALIQLALAARRG